MQIQDLLKFGSRNATKEIAQLKDYENPLLEDDVLVEATVVDIRFVPFPGTVGILIDLRTGGGISQERGNTAVIICRNVTEMQLLDFASHQQKVFLIGASGISLKSVLDVRLEGMSYGRLYIKAGDVSVLVGNVSDIGIVADEAS